MLKFKIETHSFTHLCNTNQPTTHILVKRDQSIGLARKSVASEQKGGLALLILALGVAKYLAESWRQGG